MCLELRDLRGSEAITHICYNMMLNILEGKIEDVLGRATCGNTAVDVGDPRSVRWRGGTAWFKVIIGDE